MLDTEAIIEELMKVVSEEMLDYLPSKDNIREGFRIVLEQVKVTPEKFNIIPERT